MRESEALDQVKVLRFTEFIKRVPAQFRDRLRRGGRYGRVSIGTAVVTTAILCFASPVLLPASWEESVGVALLGGGCAEILHSFRLAGLRARRSAYLSGIVSVLMGFAVLAAPLLLSSALTLFLVLAFASDGIQQLRRVYSAWREGETVATPAALALENFGIIALLLFNPISIPTLALAGGLRLLVVASSMLSTPVLEPGDAGRQIAQELNLPDDIRVQAVAEKIALQEEAARTIDRRWILVYLITLFAMHVARMPVGLTLLGMTGPFVAVLGDAFIALVVSFVLIAPGYVLLSRLLRKPLQLAFHLAYASDSDRSLWRRLLRRLLVLRLRFAIRMRQASYSLVVALERGLALGLPVAAVIAGTVPVWGMNWYFDTEKWASGIRDGYAANRTYVWREAMVRASTGSAEGNYSATDFSLEPDLEEGDFGFIVIGDTGEGDASQLVLKDQILACGSKPEVRFLLISSDVVYPDGAMRDYEHRFFLPFKGFKKPIYAIPGNHDWYDSLEAFTAVFFEPEAARRAILARVESDRRLTTTTEPRIDSMISQAQRLAEQYQLEVGHQRAPYFQIQTEEFALIAIDTGILRRLDPDQKNWFRLALEAARGKFVMVVLGHPFFAEGIDWTPGKPEFEEIREMVREAGVSVVMAGDTHDFEYYFEPGGPNLSDMHHFVNGGGGAFISYGPALAFAERPALQKSAIYPTTLDVKEKLGELTPWYKRPLWIWVRDYNAWPFSAKWLSAAFDYNRAPFHQSFVEVQVKRSEGVVRFTPWGVHGPLRWSDLQLSPGFEVEAEDAPAVFEIPLAQDS